MNSKISLKVFALSLLACIILSGTVTYVLAQTPTPTFWVSPGTYPGATSYTFWREGSYYFAKNEYGYLAYSGTNASLVVNNAIGSGGVTVLFMPDITYEFTARILVQNYTHLFGYGATLSWNNASQNSGIVWDGSVWADPPVYSIVRSWKEGITIEGFIFDGNKSSGGVHFERARRSTIKNNLFIDCNAYGDILWGHEEEGDVIENNIFLHSTSQACIWLTGGTNDNRGVFDTIVSNNHMENYSGRGILLEGFGYQKQVHVTDNTMIGRNVSGGIEFDHFTNVIVKGNYIKFNYHGLNIKETGTGDSEQIIIDGNIIEYSFWHGIFLSNTSNIIITSNIIKDNGQEASVYSSGVYIQYSTNTTVMGNHIWNSEATGQYYGIREYDALSDYNVIIGNTVKGAVSINILTAGTNTKVNLCWNGSVWIA